jgi:pentapeptide MXKDX repeat protein
LAWDSLDGWASEEIRRGPIKIRSLKMRSIWVVIPAAVVGFGIGLGIAGCGSSTPPGKDKMGGDKMSTDKMGGEKMDGGKMGGEKMKGDKMDHKDKM